MSAWEEAGWWLLLVLGMLGTALHAGLETGLYVLDPVKLEVRAAHGPHREAARRLRAELEQPGRLLATNLVWTLLFSDVAAVGASGLLGGWGYSDSAVIVVNVLVLA